MAASYGFSISANHPFIDGNKRTAYVNMRLFLKLNGHDIVAKKVEKIQVMLDLAAGKINRDSLELWLKNHVVHI